MGHYFLDTQYCPFPGEYWIEVLTCQTIPWCRWSCRGPSSDCSSSRRSCLQHISRILFQLFSRFFNVQKIYDILTISFLLNLEFQFCYVSGLTFCKEFQHNFFPSLFIDCHVFLKNFGRYLIITMFLLFLQLYCQEK